MSDSWQRPLDTLYTGGGYPYPSNYFYNTTACNPYTGCGEIGLVPNYQYLDYDVMALYNAGNAVPGRIPIPPHGSGSWTVLEDEDGSGALITVLAQGAATPSVLSFEFLALPCPATGCWPPPHAPPVVVESTFSLWSNAATWSGTVNHPANPLNVLGVVVGPKGAIEVVVTTSQTWEASLPSQGDNVWIPAWKKVC